MDKNQITALVLLDFSKAFDSPVTPACVTKILFLMIRAKWENEEHVAHWLLHFPPIDW